MADDWWIGGGAAAVDAPRTREQWLDEFRDYVWTLGENLRHVRETLREQQELETLLSEHYRAIARALHMDLGAATSPRRSERFSDSDRDRDRPRSPSPTTRGGGGNSDRDERRRRRHSSGPVCANKSFFTANRTFRVCVEKRGQGEAILIFHAPFGDGDLVKEYTDVNRYWGGKDKKDYKGEDEYECNSVLLRREGRGHRYVYIGDDTVYEFTAPETILDFVSNVSILDGDVVLSEPFALSKDFIYFPGADAGMQYVSKTKFKDDSGRRTFNWINSAYDYFMDELEGKGKSLEITRVVYDGGKTV